MSDERGFTIVEVVVAILALTIGLVGLASTIAVSTRMIGQGQRYAEAATMAQQKFELLRARPCPTVATGRDTATNNFIVGWRVTAIGAATAVNVGRQVEVWVRYPTGVGFRTDSFATTVGCVL